MAVRQPLDNRLLGLPPLLRERRFEEAVALVRQIVEDSPDDAELVDKLGSVLFLAGEYDEALGAFRRVGKMSPSLMGRALINEGAVLNRVGKHEEALKVLRKGIARERKSAEGFYNIGLAHRKLGQNSLAVPAYREAIRIKPDFADAHYNLGNVLLDQGAISQAINQYENALSVRPDFKKATAAIEAARQKGASATIEANPFGRLVDVEKGQKSSATARDLDDVARDADRAALRRLAREVEESARQFAEGLRQELGAALFEIETRLTQGKSGGVRKPAAAYERFREARRQSETLRLSLRRKMLELWAHEEMLNAPLGEDDAP